MHELSPTNQKIGLWIIEHQHKIPTMDSEQLASEINVAQSSIIKFCQKVGKKGFTAFKIALSEELGRNKHQHKIPLHNQITADDSMLVIAQKLANDKIQAIIQTTEAINHANFESAISAIDKAKKVQILGIGGSALTAKDLSFKLLKLGINCLAESDPHVQIAIASTLTSSDVQLVISFSGKSKEIQLATKTAAEKGACIIAITNNKKSPLSQNANICLYSIADEIKNRSSSIAARSAQNTITDFIFMAMIKKREEMAQHLLYEISNNIRNIK